MCGGWIGSPGRPARPGLFAGLEFGLLHHRMRTTRPAFGSAEPNRRQILVGVVARADLPAMDVGAQGYQPIPPKRVDIVRLLVQHALVVLKHLERAASQD